MKHSLIYLLTPRNSSGFHFAQYSLLVLLMGCSGRGPGSSQPPGHLREYFNAEWAMDKHWDDGLAEVAGYEAERVIYKKPRQYEYTQITVKEDFNREHNVKTDDYSRGDLYPVMKVNQFARIPTDNYPYHFLSSLFFRRENPVEVFKMTVGSQEWCGSTFKAFNVAGGHYEGKYNSYWDGQGEGTLRVDGEVLFEDQLPYTFRSLKFAEDLRFEADVVEYQQTNKANPPQVYRARLGVVSEASPVASVPGKAWRVTVQLDAEKKNLYWFSSLYPHVLLRQRTWDGRNLDLKSLERYAYWQN